jgi:hypothetical protein
MEIIELQDKIETLFINLRAAVEAGDLANRAKIRAELTPLVEEYNKRVPEGGYLLPVSVEKALIEHLRRVKDFI